MAIDGRFILPPDVVVMPVAELSDELRHQIEHEPGDLAVTRPRSRTPSSIVNGQTASLLERFRAPHTIVDAVIAFSAAEGVDPRQTLEDAFPVFETFIAESLLVPADSELTKPIETLLSPGERLGDYEIVEAVHVVVDTEVYRSRAPDGSLVALKVARPPLGQMPSLFDREGAVLRHLDGRVNPRLVEHDEGDSPFLALSWCDGVDAYKASADARRLASEDGGAELMGLARRVVEAYVHLHGQGVLHGDVHPRNVLVDANGQVTVIDYGLASLQGSPHRSHSSHRRGIDFFMEPELATARLAGLPPPALTPAGEQYSVAAVVYLLLTGETCHVFPLDETQMLEELVEKPPLPFAAHDALPSPAVERCLRRALDKDPRQRFASLAQFLESLRVAITSDQRTDPAAARSTRKPRSTHLLLDEVLDRLAVPGRLFAEELVAPTASCMNGAAGFAYALLRIAGIRSSESLLAMADLWCARAAADVEEPAGLWNPELDIVPETVGDGSFYHAASGVHCVRALVAHSLGIESGQRDAIRSFVATADQAQRDVDVAFGRAGLLIGCSTLLEAIGRWCDPDEEAELRKLGDALADGVWGGMARHPPGDEGSATRTVGVAHGCGGLLHSLLRWTDASGWAQPPGLRAHLEQLAMLGQPMGRGWRWPIEYGRPAADNPLAASWCNGAAGFVHLWTVADRTFGDEAFSRAAMHAAWTAYEWPAETGDLCCGLAGRSYALLRLYQHTGDASWLARARELAERAAASIRSSALRRDSLYRGEVGVALLAADLLQPQGACMPLFQAEGWNGG